MKTRRSLLLILTLSVLLMAEPVTSSFAVAYGVPVEMAITAEAATVYYAKCRSNCSSIVDGLKSIGVDSSYANRKKIAQVNGISNYSGTAAQNTKLLNLLKQGRLIKSATSPVPSGTTTVYYPKCGSNYSSIVDGLRSIGVDSSYTNRKVIAQVNGISNYSGTAAQNTQMLNLLKQGRLIKSKGSSGGSTNTSTTVSSGWQMPMTNAYVCGNNWLTYYKARPSRPYHLGLDLASRNGDANVYAASSGTVAATGYNGSNGNYVILKHTLSGKTIYSFYCHLKSYSVSKNSSVSKGQKIGVFGNTGSASAGAHLHFAIMDKLNSSGGYYGYGNVSSGNKVTYGGTTFYNPYYVVNNKKLP